MATGDYSLDFVQGVLFSLDPNLTATFSPPAVISVVAVPEPSTLCSRSASSPVGAAAAAPVADVLNLSGVKI